MIMVIHNPQLLYATHIHLLYYDLGVATSLLLFLSLAIVRTSTAKQNAISRQRAASSRVLCTAPVRAIADKAALMH